MNNLQMKFMLKKVYRDYKIYDPYKHFYRCFSFKYKPLQDINLLSRDAEKDSVKTNSVLRYVGDTRIIYNCLLDQCKLKVPAYIRKRFKERVKKIEESKKFSMFTPIVVENMLKGKELPLNDAKKESSKEFEEDSLPQSYPFRKFVDVDFKYELGEVKYENDEGLTRNISIKEDVDIRLKAYNQKVRSNSSFPQVAKSEDPDLDIRIYEDTLLSNITSNEIPQPGVEVIGTPDPKLQRSSVPCGGCGAFLHCQDQGIPGYVPSELFRDRSKEDLRAVDCQRCYYLKRHNMALDIRVTPDVYQKALQPITQSRSLVIVIVDLMDVPCSIWPGFFDLLGSRRPVIVVGNKIDLLPLDNSQYMETITTSLVETIKRTSLWKANIKHFSLVSAKTGYGIENLISVIQSKWGNSGDVYIVGCTNAGKSSMFNALLRSDLCQVSASDLVKRATASPWPGTTLNLLKFPLLKPTGKRLFERMHRLNSEAKTRVERKTSPRSPQDFALSSVAPTLLGQIGRTYQAQPVVDEEKDPFSIRFDRIPVEQKQPPVGIDPTSGSYRASKWCYDTPGTVHPDQFLTLLSHEELIDVLPRTPITPRCFSLRSSQSIFIAGIARLDLLYCETPAKLTVCAANSLPITIVPTADASSFYSSYLGTELFKVPRGGTARLERWPALKPTNFKLTGIGRESVSDVVLSSAGFVSITGDIGKEMDFRAWTPGGRGVHIRSPSMIPFAYKFRGKREFASPRFHNREVKLDND